MQMCKAAFFIVAVLSFGTSGYAQTLHKDRGPAELPPVSFTGYQYIDSKGCVYLRAGYGANVRWVPRVNRKRQVICSSKYKPSLSNSELASLSNQPQKNVQKPAAQKQAQPKKVQPKPKAPAQIKTVSVPKQTNTASDITAAGNAQTEKIWSNTVPRKLISENPSAQPLEVSPSNTIAHTSAKYIQVATFGDPNNAQRTAARFKTNGLPVRTRDVQVNGRAFKVVLLGPFNADPQVSSALSAANTAGFRDAFVTR